VTGTRKQRGRLNEKKRSFFSGTVIRVGEVLGGIGPGKGTLLGRKAALGGIQKEEYPL